MSDDTADAEVEVEEIEQKGQKHEASRDLDRVTNNFEEKEVDASKIGNVSLLFYFILLLLYFKIGLNFFPFSFFFSFYEIKRLFP